jgi:hypothetical protein
MPEISDHLMQWITIVTVICGLAGTWSVLKRDVAAIRKSVYAHLSGMTMGDGQSKFITRAECDARTGQLCTKISEIRCALKNADDRQDRILLILAKIETKLEMQERKRS